MSTTIAHNLETDVLDSREGDQAAFGRIVSRYQQMVTAVAYSHTGDAALSEDIAQETFLAAWQRLGRLRHPERLPAWLAGIARNKARDAWRARERNVRVQTAAQAESLAPQTAAESDQAVLVWESLEQMPAHYREVLVLYYREGRDIAETAALLGLTEDCVKQRLSRGRSMLRARVADAVEDVLTTARPNPAFTIAVLSALPALTTAHAAAQTAGEGAALSVAGKGVAAAGIGAFAGVLAGMAGSFFGIWASIRNCPTLRARRYAILNAAQIYGLLWSFFGYQALCGLLLWPWLTVMIIACAVGWVLYLPLMFILIWRINTTRMRLLYEDAGLIDAPHEPLEESALSLARVRRAGMWALVVAVPASLVVAWWLQMLPGIQAGWAGLALGVLSHYVFWRVYRHGMATAADEAIFEETAPAGDLEMWLGAANRPVREPSPRARYWNDVAAMLGCTWGPAAWLLISPALADQWGVFTTVLVNCLLVTVLSTWLLAHLPQMRHRIFFGFLLYLGVFDGLIIGLYSQAWLESRVTGFGMQSAWWYGWAGAAAYFGLSLTIGLALLLEPRWRRGPKDLNFIAGKEERN